MTLHDLPKGYDDWKLGVPEDALADDPCGDCRDYLDDPDDPGLCAKRGYCKRLEIDAGVD